MQLYIKRSFMQKSTAKEKIIRIKINAGID